MPFESRGRRHRAPRHFAISGLVPLAIAATPSLVLCCNGGSSARPEFDAGVMAPVLDGALPEASSLEDATPPLVDVFATPPDVQLIYGVCVDGVAPSFASLYAGVFATRSCGIGNSYDCHSSTGARPMSEGGTGSLLDFSLDASNVFAELLGDGSGVPAVNVLGTDRNVLRIAPGNADASLLYIKLAMPTSRDPLYGEAMPPSSLVCPATLEAVKSWIADGASPR